MRRSLTHPPLPLAALDTMRACVRRCLVDWCVDTRSCDVLVRAPEPHLTPGNDARRTCGHTRTSCSCRCSKYVVVQLPSNKVACDGSRVAVTSSQALSNVPLAGASISVPAMVERVFPISTALGVGLSYGGEAVGTAVSPIMLPWTGSNVRRMRAALGLSFLIGGVGFALDVVAPLLGAIGFAVLLAGQIVSGFAWSLQYVRLHRRWVGSLGRDSMRVCMTDLHTELAATRHTRLGARPRLRVLARDSHVHLHPRVVGHGVAARWRWLDRLASDDGRVGVQRFAGRSVWLVLLPVVQGRGADAGGSRGACESS